MFIILAQVSLISSNVFAATSPVCADVLLETLRGRARNVVLRKTKGLLPGNSPFERARFVINTWIEDSIYRGGPMPAPSSPDPSSKTYFIRTNDNRLAQVRHFLAEPGLWEVAILGTGANGQPGNVLAFLQYYSYEGGLIASIKDMRIPDQAYRGDKLGTLLFAEMVASLPSLKIIETRLQTDNFTAYYDAKSKGLDHEQAMKETPAYKIRKKFGFTTILGKDHPEIKDYLGKYWQWSNFPPSLVVEKAK
ncbi:MAG: hypothetical protein AB1540_15150 [Bdellovibrionota bacterium]